MKETYHLRVIGDGEYNILYSLLPIDDIHFTVKTTTETHIEYDFIVDILSDELTILKLKCTILKCIKVGSDKDIQVS